MAGQTKEDILITARELFNEYGYKNISMRDIAKKLNISVGNLTYYFKKKEDLIEEVGPSRRLLRSSDGLPRVPRAFPRG